MQNYFINFIKKEKEEEEIIYIYLFINYRNI